MAFERFVARHISRGAMTTMATIGVAIGVMVMIVAVSVLQGFQRNISEKVIGFGGDIIVRNYDLSQNYTDNPIRVDSTLLSQLANVPRISHVATFADKGGMVKTADQIAAIVFHGIDTDADTTFFHSHLVAGRLPHLDSSEINEVAISLNLATRLNITTNDRLRTYFWQDNTYRSRMFNIVGIYNTDLTDVDEVYIVGNIRQVRRLSAWDDSHVGGIALRISDFAQLDRTKADVEAIIPYNMIAETIVSRNPALFSWLQLLDSNITMLLIIMFIVCAVAVVSSLLIMIFRQRPLIATLRTLGSSTGSISHIFIIRGLQMTTLGTLSGAALGLLVCFVQQRFEVIHLDPESYSMSIVPIQISPLATIAIILSTIILCLISMLLPAYIMSRNQITQSSLTT